MNYYQVKLAKEFTDAPVLVDWFGKIDVEAIKSGTYDKIPKRTILPVRSNANLDFTGIVTKPVFLVKETIYEVLALFEPNLSCSEVYLLDKKNGIGEAYVLPHLKPVQGKMKGNTLYLEPGAGKDTVIFKVRDEEEDKIFMRLDLVEAVLRRDEYCLELMDVEIEEMK